MITVEQRIRMIVLIEKMCRLKAYGEKLGLEDISRFRGKRIHGEEEKGIC